MKHNTMKNMIGFLSDYFEMKRLEHTYYRVVEEESFTRDDEEPIVTFKGEKFISFPYGLGWNWDEILGANGGISSYVHTCVKKQMGIDRIDLSIYKAKCVPVKKRVVWEDDNLPKKPWQWRRES